MELAQKNSQPAAQEIRDFIVGLCTRDDLELARFFRDYFIRDQHVERLPLLFDWLTPLIRPADKLLDVGSFGEWPLVLWRFLGLTELSACSLEGGYLAYGAGALKAPDEQNKEFELLIRQINLEKEQLPHEDASLDVITCFEVLEHLRYDPVFMMSEFNRVLRPGGLLLLTTPNIGSYEGLVRLLNQDSPQIFSQYFPDGNGIGHCKEYAPNEVRLLCRNCGFDIDTLETFNSHPPIGIDRATLESFEGLKRSIERYGWSEALSGQTMLVIARRTSNVRYRYYQPLYTVTEPAQARL